MLVLTRRITETMVIGDDIRVVVLGISGNQVKLGIEAPKNVSVHREEIYNKIKSENDGITVPNTHSHTHEKNDNQNFRSPYTTGRKHSGNV